MHITSKPPNLTRPQTRGSSTTTRADGDHGDCRTPWYDLHAPIPVVWATASGTAACGLGLAAGLGGPVLSQLGGASVGAVTGAVAAVLLDDAIRQDLGMGPAIPTTLGQEAIAFGGVGAVAGAALTLICPTKELTIGMGAAGLISGVVGTAIALCLTAKPTS